MMSGNHLYPLTESQNSIWYLEKAYPGTSLNIVAGTLRMTGDVSYDAIVQAHNLFVKNNDAMRLRITEKDGVASQYIAPYEPFEMDFFDFSQSGGNKALFAWDEQTTRQPFDINEEQLFYCAMFKISDTEGGYYMKMHHLISDAWTMGLYTRYLINTYSAIIDGRPVDDKPAPSFIDHLERIAAYEQSARFEKDKAYWESKFQTLPEPTVLKQRDKNEPSIKAKRKTLITPVKFSNKLREFSQENQLSVFTLFMAALSIYINRVRGLGDLVLGTTTLNRAGPKEKQTAGMFVSVAAPVRIAIDDNMDFTTFAAAMLRENTKVLKHQKYPYNYLVKYLKKTHTDMSRLFDIVLNYQNAKFQKNETDVDYVGKWLFNGYQVESLVISINDREDGGNLIIDYDYLTDVFSVKEIEFIHAHIISLLWHALDNPAKPVSKLEMLSEKEKLTVLHDFNNTATDYPQDKTLSAFFEEQAVKTPDKAALSTDDGNMSYAALDKRTNALARRLRQYGVGSDKVVAIMTERSTDMMVGLLGILKAGGAYMPIASDYPADRVAYMLENSGAELMLTHRGLADDIVFDGRVLALDDDGSYDPDTSALERLSGPENLAYVIYTSGSTGRPKGVMVEQKGVVNRIWWMLGRYPFNADSVIMQKTTFCFDVSVWELFSWFFVGASLYLLGPGDEKEPGAIIKAVEKHGVTAMHFVPSMLSMFLNYVEGRGEADRLKSLVNVFASGEALTLSQVGAFNTLLYETNGTTLTNLYGPTEATVEVSYFECSPMPALKSVPIGKPISNINLYIFDRNRNLLPVGIPGELYIGGVGVARGYQNNPEQTDEQFIINPFDPTERLFKTGDRVRWYPMGDIEFLGRMDNQVKIRGFRIELGEIESKLLAHPLVRDTVVQHFEQDGAPAYLAAFVVTNAPVEADELKRYLAKALPDYMIPAAIVFLDSLPLNSSGKADRKALTPPGAAIEQAHGYAAPVGKNEQTLVEIWQKTLGVQRIGVLDEYAALGGESLGAIRIITDIYKQFGVELSPRDLFTLKTIRALSKHIAKMTRQPYAAIPRVPKSDYYAVSAAQKRLYIVNEMNVGTSYNLPGYLCITGQVNVDKFESILRALIARHEALRTSFMMHSGEPVQIVHDDVDFRLEYAEQPGMTPAELMDDFVRPFDLGAAPLFRAKLVRVDDEQYVLLSDMHHIIADGASINIFIQEFKSLYDAQPLVPLTIQYKDFSAWHNAFLQSGKLKKQESYWLDKFSGEIPVLDLPTDFPRQPLHSYAGAKHHFSLSPVVTKSLKALAAHSDATLFMVLLAAYNVLLFKYTGQEDVIVGTPVEGRRHDALRGVMGMFVNTLAVRSQPVGEKTFKAFLAEVGDDLLSVYDNQDYPFERLVENVVTRRDASRNPLFDTTFVLQNMNLSAMNTADFKAQFDVYDDRSSKFDLTLEAVDHGDTITINVEYATALFKPETIERLASHFTNVLARISDNPSQRLHEIDILSDAERRQLIEEFNDTDANFPVDKTIHAIFEERAAEASDAPALSLDGEIMTYGTLNEKANRLARVLRRNGVGPDVVVGLLVDRSFEMIVAILGVLKAGGAYMPMDPDYPADRITYMLENSGAALLVTKRSLMPEVSVASIALDDETSYDENASNLDPVNTPADLAYIIYTSGSTGLPKGVMIEHRNLVGLLLNDHFAFDFNADDVWTLFHSYCFDFTVWEMYGALLNSGKLVIIASDAARDLRRYLNILIEEKVTVLNQTPRSMYSLIDLELKTAQPELLTRYVFLGGEALNPSMLKPMKDRYPYAQFTNLYGPSETTILITLKRLDVPEDFASSLSNIGSAIPMTKLYVLDKYKNLVPTGVSGELYAAGACVGRGYINNDELTHERFIDSPFDEIGKLYKTGDLVRMMPSAEIEYIGRVDSQVKIRGYRIELGEIESTMLKHEAVEQAVVTTFETSSGGVYICAFYKPNSDISSSELKSFLSGSLPDYMIPAQIVQVDSFSLNNSGKIDKSSLQPPEAGQLDIVLPRNATEELLACAWASVLGLPAVGIDDDFFEIGGDSLSAVKAVASLDMDINIIDFYTHPTVRQLAEKLMADSKKAGLLVNMSKKYDPSNCSVVCFPFGGASALVYRDISNSALKKDAPLNIFAVNLPGHDFGGDDSLQPFDNTAEEIAEEIKATITGEVIIYGHCAGIALATETARLLERAGRSAKAVMLGSLFVPALLNLYGGIYKPWAFRTDEQIVKVLKKIGLPAEMEADTAYMKHLVRAFRHDTLHFIEYFYMIGRKKPDRIQAPLTFFVGDNDPITKNYQTRHHQWKRYFTSVELVVLEDAMHFFINSHADELIDYIISTL